MSAATLSSDYLISLALDKASSATIRIVLFALERSDTDGVAEFEAGELASLVNTDDRKKWLDGNALRGMIRKAIKDGHLLPGSTLRRVRLPLDRVRPSGDGLRILHELDGGRALCVCDSCGHRAVYQLAYLQSGAAACAGPKCKALPKAA